MKLARGYCKDQNGFLLMELILALAMTMICIIMVGQAMVHVGNQATRLLTTLKALDTHIQLRQGQSLQNKAFEVQMQYEPVVAKWADGRLENVTDCQWRSVCLFESGSKNKVLAMADVVKK